MEIVRSDEEITKVLNKAVKGCEKGSQWPGMSYELGVRSAIEWLIGYDDDNPMEG